MSVQQRKNAERDKRNATLTSKQSKFVREYAIDGNATQAAIRAGYSKQTAHSQGPRLLENVEVAKALADDHQRHAKRCNITIDSLTAELVADRKLARSLDQPSPAITATMAIAKLHGLDVNKVEHTGKEERKIILWGKPVKAD